MAYHANGAYSGDEHDPDQQQQQHDHHHHHHDDFIGDKPTYIMEHLATFTVTQETGIVYPSDGMRRLLQLEKSNGIWSQKMQLCLDRTWVLVMDYETGNVMERFPGKSIQEPTAFCSQDPTEMYNNILVFVVTNANPAHPPEMHIFQCESISAHELVEDLKHVQSGKTPARTRKLSGAAAAALKPTPPQQQRIYRESESETTAAPPTNNNNNNINDDTSSTTSEQYERDVTVLNHCFDDIEKFIARLQHAAAATRELERRRRSRKSKKRDNGDGMLTMRTRPPHEREFADIFQKFKLSFNLLAKLKAHIHDPNAPELVHFLFTPLALIVEAAHDTYYELQLPSKVVAPLLTREAINLLANCVTSKETELWHSLGGAWLTPRDEWKGHVTTYHPTFLDKWSPDYPVVDVLETDAKHYVVEEHGDSDYNDYETSNADYLMYGGGRGGNNNNNNNNSNEPMLEVDLDRGERRDVSVRSDISADSIERGGGGVDVGGGERSFKRAQETWFDALSKRQALIVEVTYPRTANNEKELTVVRGEYLEILDDSRKWWKARNHKGDVAHVPHTIVKKVNNYLPASPDIYSNPLYSQYTRGGRDGQSPNNNQQMEPNLAAANGPALPAGRLGKKDHTVAAPPPPPPPTPYRPQEPQKSPAAVRRRDSIKSNVTTYVDEFKTMFPTLKLKRRADLAIKVTPDVFIDPLSTPADVRDWLARKEFDAATCDRVRRFPAADLLRFTRPQCIAVCGGDENEGKRLFSQLTLQKNTCKFKTVTSSELVAKLARAKEKAEETIANDDNEDP